MHRAGGTSVSVILPKEWVDRVGLGPGDVVRCVEHGDGTLGVAPDPEEAAPRPDLAIEASDRDGLTYRRIVSAFLRGYDRIEVQVEADRNGARAEVREAARDCTGLEVLDQDERHLVLENLVETGELDPIQALRRMELLTTGLCRVALDRVRDPEADAPERVERREDEVDQLARLVTRQAHVMLRDAGAAGDLGVHPSDGIDHLLAARRVERVADHALRIVDLASGRDRGADEDWNRLADALGEAIDLLEEAFRCYHDGGPDDANATVDRARSFVRDHPETLEDAVQAGPSEGQRLTRVAGSTGRIAALAGDVAELAMNRTVAPPRPAGEPE